MIPPGVAGASAGRLGAVPLAIPKEGPDASIEDNDAPGARDSPIEVGWRLGDPGGRPSSWRGRLDGAGDGQALPGFRPRLAAARGAHRATLEAKLFAEAGTKRGHRRQIEPDWADIHRELKRKHVTLSVLWDEYIERNPEGYRYSRFCELYRSWEGRVSVTMRQTHVGGDKLFVDYAGDTMPVIVDRLTGETRQAQIFVAVMGASNFTYAEAS